MKVGTKRRLFPRVALCAALVSGLVVTAGSTAIAGCETVSVPVYDIKLEADKDTYRFGETARLTATVTHEHTGEPIEKALFGAWIVDPKKSFVFGFGRTDADGEVTARLKLAKKYLRPGSVDVQTLAYKETVDATCARVAEYGEKRMRRAFVIRGRG